MVNYLQLSTSRIGLWIMQVVNLKWHELTKALFHENVQLLSVYFITQQFKAIRAFYGALIWIP